MKKLLPILLCYLLMTSQVFAVSGGPSFGGGNVNPIGTYSGLIQVNREIDNDTLSIDPVTGLPAPTILQQNQINAIGLFSLGVPTTSVARGACLIFVEGVVYTGTITASVDPDSGKLSGVLNAVFQYTRISTNPITGAQVTAALTAQANGKVNAQINGTRQGAAASARINGSSIIQVADGGLDGLRFIVDRVLECTITGFRQSTTASTVTTLTTT